MKKEFKLLQEDIDYILSKCKSSPMIALNVSNPKSAQEKANDAWCEIGKKYGFDGMSVEPVAGKSNLFIIAEVIE